MGIAEEKDSLRRTTIAGRERLTTKELRERNHRLNQHAVAQLAPIAGTVAIYASRSNEPDTRPMIDYLANRGVRILLPALRAAPAWAEFAGWDSTRIGWAAIPEPTTPTLSAAELATATLIICPAIRAGRDGTRLGTGGGWYDRALLHRSPNARLWCLVFQDELDDYIPVDEHDVAMDAVLTEDGPTPTNGGGKASA